MGIKKFFKTLNLGIKRAFGTSLPYVDGAKRIGIYGEDILYDNLNELLPNAKIYKNVCYDKDNAYGDIDFVIINENKVFILELKTWRGDIYQEDGCFYQEKTSSYGERYGKELKDPFHQIKRHIYILKKQFPKLWFEPIVFFLGADSLHLANNGVSWFTDVDALVNFIKCANVRTNYDNNIAYFKNNIVCYDKIVSYKHSNKLKSCIIDEQCLHFKIAKKEIYKKDILTINVEHHFSFDILTIKLITGNEVTIKLDNHLLYYKDSGNIYKVNLSKVDGIAVNPEW